MAGAGRGPLPSLPAALQWNAPAEECCIAVVVVLVDVCNALLACMQRSSNQFLSSLLLSCRTIYLSRCYGIDIRVLSCRGSGLEKRGTSRVELRSRG